ncbi:MAG: type III-A CRISPR-associated protein Cas10/Csm1 [Nitrososphaeria archaeon]
MSLSERDTITLGALLHDIGKFAQRAEEELQQEYKNLESYCCPKIKGRYIHQHVLYSGQFVKNFIKISDVENLVLYHHYPRNKNEKIIQLADWLSCGERRDREPEENITEVKREPLISIFSQIKIDGYGIDENYCPLISLTKDLKRHFPVKNKEEAISQNSNSENSFEYQWKKFCEGAKLLYLDNYNLLFSQLLYLLEKYTLFVPSSAYKDKPEISLYHHLKSTAAIATCLYDLNLSEEKIDRIISAYQFRNEEIMQRDDFLLVGGDISGIQDFIYSVSTEHALKGLRGRSFYLQLLSESIAKCILDVFSFSLCNLLYCGGGHFLILLPNLSDTTKKIDDLYKRINHNLFYAHQGRIGLVIAYVPFAYSDFFGNNFGEILKKIGGLLAREKKRKFHNTIDGKFFEEFEIGGESKGCEICGRELEKNNKCKLCESFEKLSSEIKNANYIEIKKIGKISEVKGEVDNWQELLKSFGYSYQFTEKKGEHPYTLKLNDTDFLNEGLSGYRFEAIYSPKETLENIADKSDGIKKYGALRMDVDNLSKIFAEGLENKTISRMSMLSHMLSLFFSIQVRNIIEETEYKDKAIIVYSGGDDLFILAAWSVLPEIAQKIYNDFKNFTCNHPKINLSGGIFIAPSKKFPVYQSAQEAGDAEDKAKHKDENKNKITFFNTPLKWEQLEELSKIKDKIVSLLKGETEEKKLPRSLLTILYSSYEEQELAKQNKISMAKIWRLLYGLKRLAERVFKKEEEQLKLSELRNTFIVNNELRENLNIAVRWADYLTREEKGT